MDGARWVVWAKAELVELVQFVAEKTLCGRWMVTVKSSRYKGNLYSYASDWRTLIWVARSAGSRLASAERPSTIRSHSPIPPVA